MSRGCSYSEDTKGTQSSPQTSWEGTGLINLSGYIRVQVLLTEACDRVNELSLLRGEYSAVPGELSSQKQSSHPKF